MNHVNYKCRQNDVIFKFIECDNEIEEVWVKVTGEKSWTVIGYDDLKKGIKKAEDKFK